jgi:hypothetical protein
MRGVGRVTVDGFRLRAHVYGLAAELGVLVCERPDMVFWDARIDAGRVTCAPITGTLSYFCCLHELGHAAMWKVAGGGEYDRECAAWAWARSVALVEPDPSTAAIAGVFLSTYEEGGAAGSGGLQ